MTESIIRRQTTRVGRDRAEQSVDHVACEEPLSIQLDCNPLAITMRTPGHDAELALGFLVAEGILTSIEQVDRVVVSAGEGGASEQLANVLPVSDAAATLIESAAVRRGTLMTSSCGVCGRERIDDLVARCRPLAAGPLIAAATLVGLDERLADAQSLFEQTGGVHGAGVFAADGRPMVRREDVGRHNAVDKVVGALFRAGRVPVRPSDRSELAVLLVSGRSSFEIVQKAVMARIPVVASVSAVTSLAVELAEACNVTLVGFVRQGGAEVYTGAERIRV